MTDQEKISIVRNRLYEWMISDIKKAAHLKNDFSGYWDDGNGASIEERRREIKKVIPDYSGGSMIGGFILSLQAIQVLSKLAYDGGDEVVFNRFIEQYMSNYKDKNLYKLRNALFKQYTGKATDRGREIASFVLSSRNPSQHLREDQNLLRLNLENFTSDVEKAFKDLFDDRSTNNNNRIITYFDKFLMEPVKPQYQQFERYGVMAIFVLFLAEAFLRIPTFSIILGWPMGALAVIFTGMNYHTLMTLLGMLLV